MGAATAVKVTAEDVAALHAAREKAIERSAKATAAHAEALDRLSVGELRRLARLRGRSVPHAARSRERLVALLR